jgi:hypothetical protein
MADIIVAELIIGPAKVYYAPIGTTLPADTVAVDGAWPVGWIRVGLTTAPLTVAYEFDTAAPDIQESLADVDRAKVSEGASFETMMGQMNLALLPLAWGGTNTVTPAGPAQPEKEEYTVGGERRLAKGMWAFEGEWVDDDDTVYPVRCFIWKGTPTEGGELEFSKSDYTEGTPLKIGALGDLSKAKGQQLFKMQRITGPVSP